MNLGVFIERVDSVTLEITFSKPRYPYSLGSESCFSFIAPCVLPYNPIHYCWRLGGLLLLFVKPLAIPGSGVGFRGFILQAPFPYQYYPAGVNRSSILYFMPMFKVWANTFRPQIPFSYPLGIPSGPGGFFVDIVPLYDI